MSPLWVRAAIGGRDGTIVKVRLLIDTGATFTTLPRELLQVVNGNVNYRVQQQNLVTGNGVIHVDLVEIAWLSCLGERAEAFPVIAHSLPAGTFVDGVLGMDFLRRYRATLMIASAKIRLD
jgi:predicted aspartyl protease